MKKNGKKKKKGYPLQRTLWKRIRAFTSVELILVIALVAIIGLSSIPFLSRFFVQTTTDDTYSRLLADFRQAQTYAMAGKQNGPWGVYYGTVGGSRQVILYQGSSYASHTNTAYDQTYAVNPNVTVTGFSDINFAQITGKPSSSATITITGTSNTTRTIQINTQGIVNFAMAGPTYTPGAPTNTPTPTATPTITPTPTYTPPSGPPVLEGSGGAVAGPSCCSSWTQTTSSSHTNRIIIVGVVGSTGPSGVTYAGQALTEINSYCNASCVSLWYLVLNNSITGSNTVQINGGLITGAGSITLSNVNQVNPIGNYNTGSSSNGSVGTTVSGTNTNQFVIDAIYGFGTLSPTSGQTQAWNTKQSFVDTGGSYIRASSSSTSISWGGGNTGSTIIDAAAIN